MPLPLLSLLVPALGAPAAGLGLAYARRRRAADGQRREERRRQERAERREALRAATGGRLRWCEPDEMRAGLTGRAPVEPAPARPGGRLPVPPESARDRRTPGLPAGPAGRPLLLRLGGGRRGTGPGAGRRGPGVGVGGGLQRAGDGLRAGHHARVPARPADAAGAPRTASWTGVGEPLAFQILLALSDTVALSTGDEGTQILLHIRRAGEAARAEETGGPGGTGWVQAA